MVSDNLSDLTETYWPFTEITPEPDTAVHDGLTVIANQLDNVDNDISWLDEQRRLQTATDKELAKLAREVSVERQVGESDERLRYRALIAKAATRSDGTFDDVAQVLRIVFGDDVSKTSIEPKADSPAIYVTVPQGLVDDIPLSEQALSNALEDLLPLGDPVEVFTDDTFVFGETGSQGLGGDLS